MQGADDSFEMSSRIVPVKRYDWNFFDKQMDMFPSFKDNFDKDFFSDVKSTSMDEEIARMKREMFNLTTPESSLKVEQPFVQDFTGDKKMALRFDCSQFNPEEIQVKTMDKQLTVHAKHEEVSPGRKVFREFTKSYTLPQDVDPLSLKSSLTKDGFLQVEAPAPKTCIARKEIFIPIEKMLK
ncbi:unnamed protein product [Mytilus coruscus]|uniref:SHSP domain-containing protein n=1 Tax=Mytilus coruscus TaxID=42192 RepID=A0A6J8C6I2_MYTCO|nr:unnamed protein product [Mytilus coruscus]